MAATGGISGELSVLFDLHQQGALTAEEFTAAKQAVLARYSVPSDGPPTSVASPALAAKPTEKPYSAPLPPPLPEIDVSHFGPVACGANASAIGHLRTILSNLRKFPNEEKYRKLRLTNPRLSSELFNSDGPLSFLRSLGFELVSTDDGAAVDRARRIAPSASISVGEGDLLLLPTSLDAQVIAAAEEQLGILEERDMAAQRAQADYSVVRRSIGMQVRREKAMQSLATGDLRAHIAKEVLRNHPLDAMQALELVSRVLDNIAASPDNATFRALPAHNPLVQKLISTFGVLEFFLYVVGFELCDEGLILPGSVQLGAIEEAKVVNGQLIAEVQGLIDTNKATAMTELDALRKEELRQIRKRRHVAADVQQPQPKGSGKRVPISEALQILLGKRRSVSPDDDDHSETEHPST